MRLKSDPESVLPAIRDAVASVDKDLPLVDVRTQTEQIDELLSHERLFAALSGAFGVLALVLACIGIYGIMAYTVARRINEIGIRIALGAQTGQVLRMVLGEASWLAVLGIGIGLGCALWLTRFLSYAALWSQAERSRHADLAALLLLGSRAGGRMDPGMARLPGSADGGAAPRIGTSESYSGCVMGLTLATLGYDVRRPGMRVSSLRRRPLALGRLQA